VSRIIAIANQKGGVGKTTTSINLGVALAQSGARVLLVDLDPQASLTGFFSLDPYRMERSTYSLLLYPEVTVARIVRPVGNGLSLLPGSVDLATAAIRLVQANLPLDRLRTTMRESRLSFDYVLIDTPPGLNVLTVVGLLAADETLVPTQVNHMAIQGVRAIQDVIKRIRENMGNPGLTIGGILGTFYDSASAYAPQTLSELQALLKAQMYRTVIPYDPSVADAPYRGKAVVDFAPESLGAKAYRALAAEIAKSPS
jgi:chromosome partitioning protein